MDCLAAEFGHRHFDGKDLRREPLERRKILLMRLLAWACVGLQVNDHIAAAGDVVFRYACQLGYEGIVSKRIDHIWPSANKRVPLAGLEPFRLAQLALTAPARL